MIFRCHHDQFDVILWNCFCSTLGQVPLSDKEADEFLSEHAEQDGQLNYLELVDAICKLVT